MKNNSNTYNNLCSIRFFLSIRILVKYNKEKVILMVTITLMTVVNIVEFIAIITIINIIFIGSFHYQSS